MARFTDMDDVIIHDISHATTINADQDQSRLPEGMERVGYDADTERYTFRDADGSLWESAPGSRYGQLRPMGQRASPEDVEAMNVAIEEDHESAMRTMLPFGVLIIVFLFVVFRVVV
ncbi:hypothetical protein DE146DRAFT_460006 [Phaeosphaeria sp. MPI-PUGE-AT-0046c]|nr:hypothetical protein DE146DRAFT_460006 [Phaeosphaeria sp. MPI-PUGE-AT-0046c]